MIYMKSQILLSLSDLSGKASDSDNTTLNSLKGAEQVLSVCTRSEAKTYLRVECFKPYPIFIVYYKSVILRALC